MREKCSTIIEHPLVVLISSNGNIMDPEIDGNEEGEENEEGGDEE